MTISTDPATLVDRSQVIDTVNRMAWYQDRRQWAELSDLLADEIRVGYGGSDVELVSISRDDLLANWRSGLEHTSSQHILTGVTVDITGDTARATLNETVWLQAAADNGSSLYQFGTAMDTELRRGPAGWQITHLKVVLLWSAGNSTILGNWQPPN